MTSSQRRAEQARAERARVRDQLSKTTITAPISGAVTRLDVELGEMVVMGVQNQPGTILMTISDLSTINAEVKVAEADVMRLAVGQPASVTLEALTGQRFPGAWSRSAPAPCRRWAPSRRASSASRSARIGRHSAPARPDVRCGDRRGRQAQHPGRAAAGGGRSRRQARRLYVLEVIGRGSRR